MLPERERRPADNRAADVSPCDQFDKVSVAPALGPHWLEHWPPPVTCYPEHVTRRLAAGVGSCPHHGCPLCHVAPFTPGFCVDCQLAALAIVDHEGRPHGDGHQDPYDCRHCAVCGLCPGAGDVCRLCQRCRDCEMPKLVAPRQLPPRPWDRRPRFEHPLMAWIQAAGYLPDCVNFRWSQLMRSEVAYFDHSYSTEERAA